MPVPCRSCGAPVVWLTHHRTGRPAPIDAAPDPEGNVVALTGGRYRILTADDDLPGVAGARRTSHFATCPTGADWRRR